MFAYVWGGHRARPARKAHTARCKQAEHRSEFAGEGCTGKASKKTRVRKGGGLWEEGEEQRGGGEEAAS